MTDYRDIHTPNYNYDNQQRTRGNEKSPVTGILIALAVIAFVFLGLSMLGGGGTTDDGVPTVSGQTTAPQPAPTTTVPQPSN